MKKICFAALIAILAIGLTSYSAKSKNAEAYATICFDDAHSSVYTLALPILQQYDLHATVYVPTIGIEEKSYWHMSWDQIVSLQKVGWEIGSHSHTHKSFFSLSKTEIENELQGSKRLLAKHGILANTFAAPFGDINEEIRDLTKKYYSGLRGTEKVREENELEKSLNSFEVDQYDIASIQLWYNYSFDRISTLINQAIEQKKWIVFYLHEIVDETPDDPHYKFDIEKLSTLASYLKDLENLGYLRVVTVDEFLTKRSVDKNI